MSNFVLTPNAVAKLRRAIAPRSGNTGAPAASGRPIDHDKFPPPFTVRWSASAASGAGAWVIWLPDKAQIVMLKDEYITPTGVTAEQALPAGWYTIDDATASSDAVWLVVTITKSGSGEIVSVDVELSTAEGQAGTGENVHNILVAEMETDAETSAKRVKQYVDSAVVLGGEGGGVEFLHAFEVRWAPNETHPSQQGADTGSWVIWLPDPYQVAWDGNGALAPGAGVTLTPCATLPSGWYMVGRVRPQDSEVWVSYNSTLRIYGLSRSTSGLTQPWMLVATMDTSTKAVTQYVDSALFFSNGGGSVTLDNVSTDHNGDGKVQIKDWSTGTSASSTTIAQDIHDGNTTAQGAVVERTTGGVLQYKKPGSLAQLLGSSVSKSSQKILTGLTWNATTHKLVISSANITVANGVITGWTDNNDENIDTTPISNLI